MALPNGAVGWYAMCDCDISLSYSLTCDEQLNHLDAEKRAGCFTLIVFRRMFCDCLCSVAIFHGAVGWHAVCDCGIS